MTVYTHDESEIFKGDEDIVFCVSVKEFEERMSSSGHSSLDALPLVIPGDIIEFRNSTNRRLFFFVVCCESSTLDDIERVVERIVDNFERYFDKPESFVLAIRKDTSESLVLFAAHMIQEAFGENLRFCEEDINQPAALSCSRSGKYTIH
jgi:hypothetical protein